MSKLIYKRMSEKAKVGIITFYQDNYNYGGLLQAYALPTALQKYFGLYAEQIGYVMSFGEDAAARSSNGKVFRIGNLIYRLGILFFRNVEHSNLSRRKSAFDQFISDIPHSNQTYDVHTISECKDSYRICICGGDQIWNDHAVALPSFNTEEFKTYSLQFAGPQTKKIAYAPSMAVLAMSEKYKTIMKKGLSELDAISVRERRSVPVLRQITEREISVVVDPVLLLTETEWNDTLSEKNINRKYILCYLLGNSEEQRKAVKKLARRLHLRIVTFPHILGNVVRKSDLFFGDIRDYTSGPREFLGLIKNAEYVITDSFHACVFSMIFQTPFAVFERHRVGEKGNMNSRIFDFLEEYHLEDQLVTEEALAEMQEIPQIDFSYAHEHWKQRREESLEYLENALKDNENGAQ